MLKVNGVLVFYIFGYQNYGINELSKLILKCMCLKVILLSLCSNFLEKLL